MARVKRALIRRTRTKKLFQRTKGFFLSRRTTRRQAMEAVLKAQSYKFRGRKEKKRLYRGIWIQRISAAAKANGTSYSRLIHGLKVANIDVNRKMLSEIAIHDPGTFSALVQQALTAAASA